MPAPPEQVKALLRPVERRFRLATRSLRMLPSFLIVGAQRAGTTALFYYLRIHPEIAPPRGADAAVEWPKEIHFFDEKFGKGVRWYRSFFPLRARQRLAERRGASLIAGEATPSYLFYPLVPERVAATLPEVRVIAMLRDPIERAYSHYQLMWRTGREKLSFEEAVAAEEKRLARERERFLAGDDGRLPHHRHRSYIARSLYAEQLERWLEHFPRDQLLVLRAEDFKTRPVETYEQVLSFLGVRQWQPEEFVPRNIGSYAPIEPELRARLEERFAESNARLAHMLGDDFGWTSVSSVSATERTGS